MWTESGHIGVSGLIASNDLPAPCGQSWGRGDWRNYIAVTTTCSACDAETPRHIDSKRRITPGLVVRKDPVRNSSGPSRVAPR